MELLTSFAYKCLVVQGLQSSLSSIAALQIWRISSEQLYDVCLNYLFEQGTSMVCNAASVDGPQFIGQRGGDPSARTHGSGAKRAAVVARLLGLALLVFLFEA